MSQVESEEILGNAEDGIIIFPRFFLPSGAGFLSVAKVGVPIVAEVTGPMAGKCAIPVMGGHLIPCWFQAFVPTRTRIA